MVPGLVYEREPVVRWYQDHSLGIIGLVSRQLFVFWFDGGEILFGVLVMLGSV